LLLLILFFQSSDRGQDWIWMPDVLISSEKPQPIKMASKSPGQAAAGFEFVTPTVLAQGKRDLRRVASLFKDEAKASEEEGAVAMTPLRPSPKTDEKESETDETKM
jgi:hypothetical protein